MTDTELKKRLKSALQAIEGAAAPDFESTWAKAERRYHASRRRYRRFARVAVAAVVAFVAVVIWPRDGNDHNALYLEKEDLMSSTQWFAPSDVLLPEHRFDLYGELPVLIETTEIHRGLPL